MTNVCNAAMVAFVQITMTNEYPLHNDTQSWGHSGIWVAWLWAAITLDVVSHTAHLNKFDSNCQGNIFVDFLIIKYYLHPPADERRQHVPGNADHVFRQCLACGQPVRVVVAGSTTAVALWVTDNEGHGGGMGEAAGVPERPFYSVRMLY